MQELLSKTIAANSALSPDATAGGGDGTDKSDIEMPGQEGFGRGGDVEAAQAEGRL